MKVYPSGLPDIGKRVAPTNVSDEFLATKDGNNASTFDTVGGFHIGQRNVPFMPSDSYTFDQLIAWNPFDRTDTPIRLLVTFDTATQKKVKLSIPVPQYHNPANFKINLACGEGALAVTPSSGSRNSATQGSAQTQQSAAPQPHSSPVAAAQTPSSNNGGSKVDPCASHAGAPAQNVVLAAQTVHATQTVCHGFGCLNRVTSVLGPHGLPQLPGQFADAFSDAQLVSGLGDKASWKDGKLTVLRADMAFQVLVHGTASAALDTSEALARDVLVHVTR